MKQVDGASAVILTFALYWPYIRSTRTGAIKPLSLDNYSLTTVLFPAAIGVACLLLALILIYRQRTIVGNG